ncbi:MAG TPA: hypothetical protein DCM86_15315, partial [Verrucomicrobiales bacterium]|nr:hypothetical protein [Verrucomicrobiales bacterium]
MPRDGKLYKSTHSTFEAYCKERWGMGKAYANRTIQAAQVVGLLPTDTKVAPMGANPPSERVLRPLTKLPMEVGNALMSIRDGKLYKATHSTFEAYCKERWNMSKRSAYHMIGAADVVANVHHGAQIGPDSERVARPLTTL